MNEVNVKGRCFSENNWEIEDNRLFSEPYERGWGGSHKTKNTKKYRRDEL